MLDNILIFVQKTYPILIYLLAIAAVAKLTSIKRLFRLVKIALLWLFVPNSRQQSKPQIKRVKSPKSTAKKGVINGDI